MHILFCGHNLLSQSIKFTCVISRAYSWGKSLGLGCYRPWLLDRHRDPLCCWNRYPLLLRPGDPLLCWHRDPLLLRHRNPLLCRSWDALLRLDRNPMLSRSRDWLLSWELTKLRRDLLLNLDWSSLLNLSWYLLLNLDRAILLKLSLLLKPGWYLLLNRCRNSLGNGLLHKLGLCWLDLVDLRNTSKLLTCLLSLKLSQKCGI
jgi:hypothetical protein